MRIENLGDTTMRHKPLLTKIKHLQGALKVETDPLVRLDLTQKLIDAKQRRKKLSIIRRGNK